MDLTSKTLGPRTGVAPWNAKDSELYRDRETLEQHSGMVVSTSPKPIYPWLGYIRQLTREVLEPYKEHIDGVFAHPEGNTVAIYALTSNREDIHDLALALGLLEVRIDQALSNYYEEVRVHPTPSWCLTGADKEAFTQGGLGLL